MIEALSLRTGFFVLGSRLAVPGEPYNKIHVTSVMFFRKNNIIG